MFGILSQTNLDIYYQKNNLKINLLHYNGQYYIPLKQLQKIFVLNQDIICSEYSLKYKDEELIFSEFSFFIVYKSNAQLRVAQMSHTSIKIDNDLCIPITPFFNAMNSLNLINTIINNTAIDIIDYSIFEKELIKKNELNQLTKQTEKLKTSIKSDTLSKKKKVKSKEMENIFKFNDNQEQERGKYIIPRSIKK
jgi:hypothetical protein